MSIKTALVVAGLLALVRPAWATNVADVAEVVRPAPYQKLRALEDCRRLANNRAIGTDVLIYQRLFDPLYTCSGGSLRLRYEWAASPELGEGEKDGSVFLHRTMLHTGLRAGRWGQAFIQLTAASVTGRQSGPSPVDQDLVDVHQAFVEARLALDALKIRLQGGRFELALGSGRLVDVREGPNVRLPFEGARLDLGLDFLADHLQVSLIGARAVRTQQGSFDNTSSGQSWLWGAYGAWEDGLHQGATLEVYYLGFSDAQSRYEAGVGEELRHTLGARFAFAREGFDTNVEAALQFGRFAENDSILAWTLASSSGFQLERWPLAPRLGLSLNVASGDRDPNDGRLETFNALFPRGNYFGQLVLLGPANFFDVHPSLTLTLLDDLLLSLDWEMFWRLSTQDAVYATNRSILRAGQASDARFVAHVFSVALDWQITRNLSFFMVYGQVFEGTFITDGGVEGTTRLVESSVVFTF